MGLLEVLLARIYKRSRDPRAGNGLALMALAAGCWLWWIEDRTHGRPGRLGVGNGTSSCAGDCKRVWWKEESRYATGLKLVAALPKSLLRLGEDYRDLC